MESMVTAQLQVIVALLDVPFADLTRLIMYDPSVVYNVIFCFDLEVHSVDSFWCESLGSRHHRFYDRNILLRRCFLRRFLSFTVISLHFLDYLSGIC